MLLDSLTLWLDTIPRPAPLNMALDEAMMQAARGPWMRVYHWESPSVSIGFSQQVSQVDEDKRTWPLVRRWTGGGVVVHDSDWTYTLAAPGDSELSEQRAPDVYRRVHEAMALALEDGGISGCTLQPESTSDGMGICFMEPAKFDLVWKGQKIAGAAQRRNRSGFLHQGSVRDVQLPPGFGHLFAARLSPTVEIADSAAVEALLMPVALELAATKYAAPEWTHERNVRPLQTA